MSTITGRDHTIICKALAYAIVAIEHLPEKWQEWSDKEDMRALLDAMAGEDRDYIITTARSHLERRGVVVEDGKLVLRARESGTVVPLR
jgi:hypothetical protein